MGRLVIGSRDLAEVSIGNISLHRTLGAYDLVIGLVLNVNSDDDAPDAPRSAIIIGAQVSVGAGSGDPQRLGFARPEEPVVIASKPHNWRANHGLYLHLHPNQLSALEELRGGEDLTFDLLVKGTGSDGQGYEQNVHDSVRTQVPRSQWIDTLRGAGARDIMLLEVSLPLVSASEDWSEVRTTLVRAEGQFRNGDYSGCVASCRTVIEELGHRVYGERDWAPKALDKLAAGRNVMAKDERESALWATVRHYAHLAHHGSGEGGEVDFGRPDAQWVLRMTVAAVAHSEAAFGRRAPLPKD